MRTIASRCAVAFSSVWPPERNTTPGSAAGTVRLRTRSVRSATSATPAWRAFSLPETTMLALRITCSSETLCQMSSLKSVASIFSVSISQRSTVWLPSSSTSGSTIGTIEASWQIAA